LSGLPAVPGLRIDSETGGYQMALQWGKLLADLNNGPETPCPGLTLQEQLV